VSAIVGVSQFEAKFTDAPPITRGPRR
jgi:hypothetical protein